MNGRVTMISGQQDRQFVEEGFLVVKGLLDVNADIEEKQAYCGYLDALAMGTTDSELRKTYAALPFAERFAILLGCSGGRVLDHLDPSLALLSPGYQRRKDLPSAPRPELFRLLTNARLLDALERIVGPEIFVSPVYHVNLKLAERQRGLARRMAVATKQRARGVNPLWDFHVGTTKWHTDAGHGLPDARQSRIINAWIPLTSATTANGCLLVEPGSHRLKAEPGIIEQSAIGTAVALPVAPGDVIFLHNKIRHPSVGNRSSDDIRWAFNFRYLPIGEPTGRPFLPGFVARSRRDPERELRDPQLWSEIWRAALDFHSMHPLAAQLDRVRDVADAEALTARWNAATPDDADWLRLDATIAT